MHSNLIVLIGMGLLLITFSGCIASPPNEFHAHADFAVYINGEKANFAQEKYMSDENNSLAPFVHLHDGKGNIIHFHAQNIALHQFLSSIGWSFDEDCLTTDTNQTYCNQPSTGWVTDGYCFIDDTNQRVCVQPTSGTNLGKTLKLYVNGVQNAQMGNYIPKDLDRILITYGNETLEQIQTQINSVTNEACIQSGKCPERGSPMGERNCTTTGGCTVDLNQLTKSCVEIPVLGKFCWA